MSKLRSKIQFKITEKVISFYVLLSIQKKLLIGIEKDYNSYQDYE